MSMRTIFLDYDLKYNDENIARVKENIHFASELLGIKIRRINILRSHSNNIHAIVVTERDVSPLEYLLFEYYAFSDRHRIYADIRRVENNYPYRYSYLFEFYTYKPRRNENMCITIPHLDIYVLYYALRHYQLY